MINLSKRMRCIADMVDPGRVCDIGCDHAKIPLYLLSQGRCSYAIGADIGEGPLAMARENARALGLLDKIDLRLSDGFSNILPGEGDTAIITGMGGYLIRDILMQGESVWSSFKNIILSPQSDQSLVRDYMQKRATILREEQVFEEGKYYQILKYTPGGEAEYTPLEIKYGRLFLRERPEVFLDFLRSEKIRHKSILNSISDTTGSLKRRGEVMEEIELIDRILDED